jgi:hypothetical protein
MLWLPVVHLPVALAKYKRGNFGSGCLQADVSKHMDLPNNHQLIPAHTLMLNCCWCLEWITVWGFSSAHWCWLWILMTPSTTKRAWSVKSTDEAKVCSALRWTKHWRKFTRAGKSALTHKLHVFGHVLIWIYFFVLVCGTHAQSFFFLRFLQEVHKWNTQW